MASDEMQSCRCARRSTNREAGLTLVELMVSIALGLGITLAATSLLLSAKSGYLLHKDSAQLQENGRYAIEAVTRAVRQAGYENWERAGAVEVGRMQDASLEGLDAKSLKGASPGIDAPVDAAVNGSDVLALRFSGTGEGSSGDGIMLNCAGFGIPASGYGNEPGRGWSIFYVGQDGAGEPELYCKFRGAGSWSSQALVRGVESFQVLYGVDTDADGVPNRLMNASSINALDQSLPPPVGGGSVAHGEGSYWTKVVLVKVAFLVRGAEPLRDRAAAARHDLFGKEYADAHAGTDPGTSIDTGTLPDRVRNRIRKVFNATILLRNQPLGSLT